MTRKTKPALSLSRPPLQSMQQKDDARAQAFIQGAEKRQLLAPQQQEQPYPWENPDLREDVVKTFNVRLPEPTKAKLQWLAQQGPRSMHQIVLEAVEAAIEEQIQEHLV